TFATSAPLGQARQVTPSQNYAPSLTPDGRSMVYISYVGGHEQFFLASLDGRENRQLTTDAADHEDPAVSPDGKTIAFVYIKEGHAQIALMPAVGGPMDILTEPVERVIHPNCSPDGKGVAYCAEDDLKPRKKNPAAIKVIDLATRRVRILISDGVNTYPVWSPDGRSLAFRRMVEDTNSEVFVADSAGKTQRNLTN